MAGVAFDPAPFHMQMAVAFRVQLLPQIGVFHRLLGRGFPAARLPAVYPFGNAFCTYWESVYTTTLHGRFKVARPLITASSSMRLLVVLASPPHNSFSLPLKRNSAPQPPGPGLPCRRRRYTSLLCLLSSCCLVIDGVPAPLGLLCRSRDGCDGAHCRRPPPGRPWPWPVSNWAESAACRADA